MGRNRRALCLGLLGLSLTLPALAAEGRIPVFGPGVLAVDGKYIVTRNITGTGAAAPITISAPNVDLDLNGFDVVEPAAAFPVINIPGFIGTVSVHNGTVTAGSAGLDAPFGGAGGKLVIEGLRVQGPGGFGIHSATESTVVRKSVIEGAGGDGILIDGGVLKTGSVDGNVIESPGGNGIFFASGNITISNNSIAGASLIGILIAPGSGCLILENTVGGAGTEGIVIRGSKGIKLFDNVVRESGSNGIHIDPGSMDNLVLNNVSTANGFALPPGSGLLVEGDQNLVERNTLNSNNCAGLFFTGLGCGNTFGRNMARGNLGACALGACAGPPALFPPNSCNACPVPANSTFGDNLIPGPPIF
jgi:parallel beta-helix repeat protein